MPPPVGDQRLVVVGPRRTRQLEQPPALGVRRGRVGVRVEEHVAVVERADQPDVLRQQHAVAEHVAGHVADPDDRELGRLHVDAELAEVALDRHPRAARGDAHRLVVVADRAARRERVAEPEAVLLRDPVGRVGERRRALVGRDDQVRVVAVVADDVPRRHDLAVRDRVGHVEQAADERAVAADDLLEQRLARGRRALHDEAALRADRHDQRVLDHLRLHQPEDLRAEVLAPVRPAQAAARDAAAAQVHALDARRVHEDLEARPRQRDDRDARRVELERDVRLRPPVGGRLEEVRPQHRADDGVEAAQDAILVEARDGVDRLLDLGRARSRRLVAALLRRVEAGAEQGDQLGGDAGVGDQRALHVAVAERDPRLAHVAGDRAQQRHLARVEAGADDQRVESVLLDVAVPDAREAVVEPLADPVRVDVGADRVVQAEVVDPGRLRPRAA